MITLQGTPIQYYSSGFYLRLNDCDDPEAYKLEMNKFLPDEDDPSRKKCKLGTVTVS
jgi:hypothetical protein